MALYSGERIEFPNTWLVKGRAADSYHGQLKPEEQKSGDIIMQTFTATFKPGKHDAAELMRAIQRRAVARISEIGHEQFHAEARARTEEPT